MLCPVSVNISDMEATERNPPLQHLGFVLSKLSKTALMSSLQTQVYETKNTSKYCSFKGKIVQRLMMTLFIKFLLYAKHYAKNLIIYLSGLQSNPINGCYHYFQSPAG